MREWKVGKVKKGKAAVRVQGWDLSLNHAAFIQLADGELNCAWYVTPYKGSFQRGDSFAGATHFIMPKKMPAKDMECLRLEWWRDYLWDFLRRYPADYVGLEDYALRAAMRAHQIGELGGLARLGLWGSGVRFRLHDPTTVKMYGALNGGADKNQMRAAVEERYGVTFDQYDVPKEGRKNPNTDTSGDLADAFVLAKMVWAEVQIRAGRLDLTDLEEKERQAFLRVTKANPVNTLGREFICREGWSAWR